jgi:O-antigen/teichoic acid export membrane protein
MSALVQKIGSLLRGDSLKTQVVLSLGLKGAGAALALCFNWAVAQLYGPLGSGLYGITQTTIVLLGIMAMGGMDYVTMRSVAGDVKLGNFPHALGLVHVVLKSASWLAIGVGLVLFVFHGAFARAVGNDRVGDMLVAACPAVFGWVFMRLNSFALRGGGNVILSQAMEGTITSSISVGLIIIVALLPQHPPVWIIGIIYTISLVVTGLVGRIGFARLSKTWGPAAKVELRPLYAMGIPLVGNILCAQSTEWFTLTSVTYFHSAEAAGALRVALQVLMVSTLIQGALEGSFGPKIAAAWAVESRAEIARLGRKMSLAALACSTPFFVVVALFPKVIMGVFRPEFLIAAPALQILAIGYVFFMAASPYAITLIMCRCEKWMLGYSLLSLLTLLAACAYFVPLYGVTGGAIAVVSALIFRAVAAGLIVRFVLKIKIPV